MSDWAPPMPKRSQALSIILPAKNEAAALPDLLSGLKNRFPKAELLVVDDGSTDDTAKNCGFIRRSRGAASLLHG